jgi:hypothetical protein
LYTFITEYLFLILGAEAKGILKPLKGFPPGIHILRNEIHQSMRVSSAIFVHAKISEFPEKISAIIESSTFVCVMT